jgi:ankyrin repeat protein
MLIERGADVNAQDDDKSTLLHLATLGVVGGHVGLIRMLIERGADLNARNRLGFTPFLLPSRRREVQEFPLAHGSEQ